MRWLELGLRVVLMGTLFFFLLLFEPDNVPIVELCLVIILVSQHYVIINQTTGSAANSPVATASQSRTKQFFYLAYGLQVIASLFFFPLFYFYLPVLFYDLNLKQLKHFGWFILTFLLSFIMDVSLYESFFVTGLSMLASYLHTIILNSIYFEETSYEEIDTLRHLNQHIQKEQASLLEMQDERANASMLSERKRIVEEIHDSLGHQLSSAVIQMAALEYTVNEPEARATIAQLKEMLSTSMTDVRSIIHTERRSAVDLEIELNRLVNHFTKCRIHFTYQNTALMNNQVTHSIVNIVKEALTNINKHSDANMVSLRFNELDEKWALLISDNGTNAKGKNKSNSGIGLINIEERVNVMGGTLHINDENGFRIFISIPQRRLSDESTGN